MYPLCYHLGVEDSVGRFVHFWVSVSWAPVRDNAEHISTIQKTDNVQLEYLGHLSPLYIEDTGRPREMFGLYPTVHMGSRQSS